MQSIQYYPEGQPNQPGLGFNALSVTIDNYSQSWAWVPGAGRYVRPWTQGACYLLSATSTGDMEWQTPAGLVPPPVGSGRLTAVWSDQAPQAGTASEGISVFSAQSASAPLAVIPMGGQQTVKIPAGIQSLALIPHDYPSQNQSIFIQGVTSGDIYFDAAPILYLPIIIEVLNPLDGSIIFSGGLAGDTFDLIGYPFPLAPNELQVASEPQNPVYTSNVNPPAGTAPVFLGSLSIPNNNQAVDNFFTLPSNSQGMLVVLPGAVNKTTLIIAEGVSGDAFGETYSAGTGGEFYASIPGSSENPIFVEVEWPVINTGAAVLVANVYAMVAANTQDTIPANILKGSAFQAGATIITVPAGRIWKGSLTLTGIGSGVLIYLYITTTLVELQLSVNAIGVPGFASISPVYVYGGAGGQAITYNQSGAATDPLAVASGVLIA